MAHKTPPASGIVMPAGSEAPKDAKETPKKICHRFSSPYALQQPDPLNPQRIGITPQIGNFHCLGDKCTLWNAEAGECFDVTQVKMLSLIQKTLNAGNMSGGQG